MGKGISKFIGIYSLLSITTQGEKDDQGNKTEPFYTDISLAKVSGN